MHPFRKILSIFSWFALLVSLVGTGTQPARMIPVTMHVNEGSYPVRVPIPVTSPDPSPATKNLAAIYAPGSMYHPIIQQPADNPAYVSTRPGQITQFGMPSAYGAIGLLAHNNLAGADFFNLQPGQVIILIFTDGSQNRFRVTSIEEFQALSPFSPYSDFVDLDNHQFLDSNRAFERVYEQPNRLVLQTCIAREGISSWGRLFVMAVPIQEMAGL
jgi:hypothetical protein